MRCEPYGSNLRWVTKPAEPTDAWRRSDWRAKCRSFHQLDGVCPLDVCRRLSQCLSCQPDAYPPDRAIIGLSDRPWFTQDKTFVQSSIVICYRNGEYLPRASATISVEDRGFIFGDGVYEVWRVVNGRLFETDRHLARLAFGLGELRIASPDIARADVARARSPSGCSPSHGLPRARRRSTSRSRAASRRGRIFPPAGTAPTVYVTVNRFTPADELRERGAAAITIPDIRWLRCDIKTIQLLPNVLGEAGGRRTRCDRRTDDSRRRRHRRIARERHRRRRRRDSHAPDQSSHPARDHARDRARDRARARHSRAARSRLPSATSARLDELFLAGTTTDVMPIVRVNDRPIGDGAPGRSRCAGHEFRAYSMRLRGGARDVVTTRTTSCSAAAERDVATRCR